MMALLFAVPALAGTVGQVDVRVVDVFSGEVLAEETLETEQRLELSDVPEHMHYVAFRREQFQDREVLEISLADSSEAWEQAGFTAWNEPASNTFRRVRLETVPRDWADRYCRQLPGFDSSAERDPSVSVVIDGTRHVSWDDWSGEGVVDLKSVSSPESEPEWQARIDSDGMLQIREGDLASWRSVDKVRDDFFMVRHLLYPAGVVEVSHDPGRYAHRFCERYENRGESYVKMIVDHIFGRESDAGEESSDD